MAALAAASTSLGLTPAPAQTAEDIETLRTEIRTSREAQQTATKAARQAQQAAEARIAELEKKLATLGAQTAALEQGQQATSQTLEEVRSPAFHEKLQTGDQSITRNLAINGYLRAGAGINEHGSTQGKITASDGIGGSRLGRLGNEDDTYLDLFFHYTLPQATEDAIKWGLHATLSAWFTAYDLDGADDNADIYLSELYVTADNVFKTSPETRLWVGKRWYDRRDVHMFDYKYLNTLGHGGGIENIPLKTGKLHLAYYIGDKEDNRLLVDNRYYVTKHTLDIRWSDLPTFGGTGMLWISPQAIKGTSGNSGSAWTPETTPGLAFGWVQKNEFGKGTNTASLQYGFRAGYGLTTAVPVLNNNAPPAKDWMKDAQTLLFTDDLLWQVSDQFSFNWAMMAQWDDLGYTPAGGSSADRIFVTTGIRPVYMFTPKLGLAGEFAVDWASDDRYTAKDTDTAMAKLLISGVIKPGGGGVMSRPELRAYAGYYYWGGNDHTERMNGSKAGANGAWVFGIQAESWW
ncbi:MAG: carbohydrate porin [Opitutaceae bacterium]|jgi:maltoporin|nr:carbohydrate porin [Opitutaceae bacterium]